VFDNLSVSNFHLGFKLLKEPGYLRMELLCSSEREITVLELSDDRLKALFFPECTLPIFDF